LKPLRQRLKEAAERWEPLPVGALLREAEAALSRSVGGNGPQFSQSCSCAMCRSYFSSTP